MREYLQNVLNGKFRYNHSIIHNYQVTIISILTSFLQDIFNLLPNLKVEDTVKSFSVKTNDYMHLVYVSTLIRSVISLHNLINNKIQTKEIEVENAKKDKEREEELKKRKEEEAKKKVEEALKKAEQDGGSSLSDDKPQPQ